MTTSVTPPSRPRIVLPPFRSPARDAGGGGQLRCDLAVLPRPRSMPPPPLFWEGAARWRSLALEAAAHRAAKGVGRRAADVLDLRVERDHDRRRLDDVEVVRDVALVDPTPRRLPEADLVPAVGQGAIVADLRAIDSAQVERALRVAGEHGHP